jgi:hypothetical protein
MGRWSLAAIRRNVSSDLLKNKGLATARPTEDPWGGGEVSGVKRKHDTIFPAACLEPLKGELVVTRIVV